MARHSPAGRRRAKRPILAREERRRLAHRSLRRGISKTEVAPRLGIARATAVQWEKRRLAEGPDSWREHKHLGSARRLTAEQQKKLQKILREGARARGYETDLWTRKRKAQVIHEEFGGEYTESGSWRLLREMGFSAQVPLPRAVERNEVYVR